MPEAATKTAAPRRGRATTTRKTTSTTTPKTETATKPAPVKEEAPADATQEKATPARTRFELTYDSETKSFSKFLPPKELSDQKLVVGQLYFPPGTDRVVVTVLGPDDVISDLSEA